MAVHETTFKFADRGATSVYKFSFPTDETVFVWFEYANGSNALFTTPASGPYRVEDPLEKAEYDDLDACLAAHETDKQTWIKDLMAQFGERIAWTYP